MAARSFLILHGLSGSGPGHWQTWLAARLRAARERVAYPDLPDADTPSPAAWRDALAREIEALPGAGVVVCHSLSCILWLHHVAGGGAEAERALLVAPPSEAAGIAEIAEFFPVPMPTLTGARIVCSADDPYCPEGASDLYAEPLGIPADVLPGSGHLNLEAGYGPWPAVEAWCLDGAAPVTA
jgi:predicted alpha/beta hydrolase family esterase